MRQTVPWNVTGVPPEARDIARAAAQREGVSVGDWLTRRILGEAARPAEDERPPERDSPEPVKARGSEEDCAIRRLDEALSAIARRLEAHERAQEEAQRVMSAAAGEIHAATSAQAVAFQHLAARIDRAERNADTGALRDAVKGLHQALSRLADQIARTAHETTAQITAIASTVEALSEKVARAREESEDLRRIIEDRLAAFGERLKQNEARVAASSDYADRLKQTEERLAQEIASARSESKHLSLAKEERLAALGQRLTELEERLRERAAEPALPAGDPLERLKAEVRSAEERMQEALGRRLSAIESNLGQIGARLDRSVRRPDTEETIEEGLRRLSSRLEAAEQDHRHALSGLRTGMTELTRRMTRMEAAFPAAPTPEAADADGPAGEPSPAETSPGETAKTDPPGGFGLTAKEAKKGETSSKDIYLAQARRAAQVGPEPRAETVLTSRMPGFPGARPHEPLPGSNRLRLSPPAAAAVLMILMVGTVLVFARDDEHLQTLSTSPESPSALEPNSLTLSGGILTTPAELSLPPSDPSPPSASETVGSRESSGALSVLAAKAEAGDAKAALQLGLNYAEGDGVPQDDRQAAHWLAKAAAAGEAVAQYRLGTFYEQGRGVRADPRQAAAWYAEAAKRGNRLAMHSLGIAYADGTGVEKDFAQAARWFRSAAELGLADSQFNLAVLHERGMGVELSLAEAYKWYAIASATGDAEALSRVEAIATQISPAERAAADLAARGFKPRVMAASAN